MRNDLTLPNTNSVTLGSTGADGIIERLRAEAQTLSRPEQRLGTLDRLVEACDDLASGKASEYLRKAAQAHPKLKAAYEAYYKRGHAVSIIPPRIEEYVTARRMLDFTAGILKTSWTGPTSAFIRGDEGILAYVRKRESERSGTGKRPKHRTLYDDLDLINDLDAQQRLRYELDDGLESKRQLQLLKQGLLKIPGIDVYSILGRGTAESASDTSCSTAVLAPNNLTAAERQALQSLVSRLMDNARLNEFGLRFDGGRVKHQDTGDWLIEKAELSALQRLVSLME